MTLVQELRAQLERVVRDPREIWCGNDLPDDAYEFARAFDQGGILYQEERIAILTAAIRAAVVTREAGQ